MQFIPQKEIIKKQINYYLTMYMKTKVEGENSKTIKDFIIIRTRFFDKKNTI